MRRGLEEIAADPAHFVRHLARKVVVFLNAHEVADNASYDFFAHHVSGFLAWPLPGWGALLPLSLCGFALAWREREARPLIAFFAVYATGLLPFFVLSRLRLPLVPVVIAFAAWLGAHPRRLREGSRARRTARLCRGRTRRHASPRDRGRPDRSTSILRRRTHARKAGRARRRALIWATTRGSRPRATRGRGADARPSCARLAVEPRSSGSTALRNLQTTRIVELLRVGRGRRAADRAGVRRGFRHRDAHARLASVLGASAGATGGAAYQRALEIGRARAARAAGTPEALTAPSLGLPASVADSGESASRSGELLAGSAPAGAGAGRSPATSPAASLAATRRNPWRSKKPATRSVVVHANT
jgi:hypothetical protein